MKQEKNLSPNKEKNVSREITAKEMKQVTGGASIPKVKWKPKNSK